MGENQIEAAGEVVLLGPQPVQRRGCRELRWQELEEVLRPPSSGLEFPAGLLAGSSMGDRVETEAEDQRQREGLDPEKQWLVGYMSSWTSFVADKVQGQHTWVVE